MNITKKKEITEGLPESATIPFSDKHALNSKTEIKILLHTKSDLLEVTNICYML